MGEGERRKNRPRILNEKFKVTATSITNRNDQNNSENDFDTRKDGNPIMLSERERKGIFSLLKYLECEVQGNVYF